MSNPKIIKTEGAEETMEILAKSITEISDAVEAMRDGPVNERTIVLLLQDYIGAQNITKTEIKNVLNALPKLKGYYLRN
tara:strand:+ start:3010 stop:3246 length:237 start_codon:yes stop_codon:yes gene_type:complete